VEVGVVAYVTPLKVELSEVASAPARDQLEKKILNKSIENKQIINKVLDGVCVQWAAPRRTFPQSRPLVGVCVVGWGAFARGERRKRR